MTKNLSNEFAEGTPVTYGSESRGYIGVPPAGMAPQPSPEHVWVRYEKPLRGVNWYKERDYAGNMQTNCVPYVYYGGWFKKSEVSLRKPTNLENKNV